MLENIRILHVEDSSADAELVKEMLKLGNLDVDIIVVSEKKEFLEQLLNVDYDLILCDYLLPEFDGLKALIEAKSKKPDTPFIFVSGNIGEDRAVQCLQLGAMDYVLKQRLDRLVPAVKRAIKIITEKKEREEAERKLSESEIKYRKIFENVQDVYYQTDNQGYITTISPSIKRYSGFTPEELIGTPVTNVYSDPEDRIKLVKEIKTSGEVVDYVVRLKSKCGKMVYTSVNAHIFFDKNGKHAGIEGSLRDVTERVIAEDKLRESEHRFRSLVESTSDWIWEVDADGKYIYVSPQVKNLLGYEPEEFIGKTCFDFIAAGEIERVAGEFTRIVSEKKAFKGIINTNVHKDGSLVVLETSGVPVLDENGNLIGYHGIDRDITERQKAEKLLIEQSQTLESFFNNTKYCVVFLDKDFNFIRVNEAYAKACSRPVSDFAGHNHFEFYPSEELKEKFVNVVNTKVPYEVLGRPFTFPDHPEWGATYWDLSLTPILDNRGEVEFLVFSLYDITERKKSEEKIRRLNRVYVVLSNINQTIIRSHNKAALLHEVCKISVEHGLYKFVWIGIVDEKNNKLVPAAFSGDGKEFLNKVNGDYFLSGKENYHVCGTIINNKVVVCNNIAKSDYDPKWKEEALKADLHSMAGLPLKINNKIFGVINFFASEVDLFDEFEVNLLEELSSDLSFSYDFIQKEENRIIIEAELQKSEAQYHALFETAADTILLVDRSTGNILEANTAASEMYGYTNSEICRMNVANLSSQPDAMLESIQTGIERIPIRYHKKKDGAVFPVEIRNSFFNINYREVAVSMISDITERIEYEKEILRAKNNWETTFNTVPDLISLLDLNHNIVIMNKSAYHELNLQLDSCNNVKCHKIFHNTDYPPSYCPHTKLLNDGKEHTAEVEIGSKMFFVTDTPLKDDEGNLTGSVHVARDITELKRTEVQLTKLSLAVEQSTSSIIITDTKGDIEYVNPKFTEVTGYSLDEVKHKNPRLLKSGETPQNEYKKLWTTILSGSEWRGEFCNKKKNGELFWEAASISPVKNSNGEIINFLCIKEDITSKKNIIKELIVAKEKAEEMSRLKSNFLANMSHELRTPMIGILGFSELLKEELTEANYKDMANTIFAGGKRLLNTLNLLLDLSRIEANKQEIKLQDVNVHSAVTSLISAFHSIASDKNLDLNYEISDKNLNVKTDIRIFEQILNNLVNNALKFTDKGSVTIDISFVPKNKILVVKVIDTGVGIKPEHIDVIFEEFRQASEGINRTYEGAGLGLTITKKSVELLGGTISVESQLGAGTTFTVCLPVESSRTKIIKPTTFTREENINPPQKAEAKQKILVVDNDGTSCDFVSVVLKNYVNIDYAENGNAAINMAAENNYSLVLMDIGLGLGMNGVQTTAHIRKLPGYETTPIIAVTAYAMKGDKELFLSQGLTHYLSKPYTRTELLSLVQEILKLK